jgi:hypothetical protein
MTAIKRSSYNNGSIQRQNIAWRRAGMTPVVDSVVARWRQLLSGSQLSGRKGHQRRERRAKQRERQMACRHINVNDYQQLAILGMTSSHTTEAWGDKILEKREGMCRVGLLNQWFYFFGRFHQR